MNRQQRYEAFKKRLQDAEDRVFAVVKPIIDELDPEKLLKLGGPDDEYDSTSRTLAEGIVREGHDDKLTVEELANMLAIVMHYEFRSWGEAIQYFPVYREWAERILPELPKGLNVYSMSSK